MSDAKTQVWSHQPWAFYVAPGTFVFDLIGGGDITRIGGCFPGNDSFFSLIFEFVKYVLGVSDSPLYPAFRNRILQWEY